MRDPYKTLGVGRSATQDEIKRAFRKLTREFHPDRHPDNLRALDRYKDISIAYKLLSDPGKRRAFDLGQAPTARRADSGPTVQESVNLSRTFAELLAAYAKTVESHRYIRIPPDIAKAQSEKVYKAKQTAREWIEEAEAQIGKKIEEAEAAYAERLERIEEGFSRLRDQAREGGVSERTAYDWKRGQIKVLQKHHKQRIQDAFAIRRTVAQRGRKHVHSVRIAARDWALTEAQKHLSPQEQSEISRLIENRMELELEQSETYAAKARAVNQWVTANTLWCILIFAALLNIAPYIPYVGLPLFLISLAAMLFLLWPGGMFYLFRAFRITASGLMPRRRLETKASS